MKIGIAITARNLLHYTKAAVESIVTEEYYKLILIDDFSTDDTFEWMQSAIGYKGEKAIAIKKFTTSLSEKWNLGAQTSWDFGCEAVLICNNDILFGPHTIDTLIQRMERGSAVGMVTGHNLRDDPAIKKPEDIYTLPVNLAPTEAPHPDFSCFLLSKETWDVVGEFDAKFKPCYFEDNDYHYRMKQADILAIAYTGAGYYHYGSRTQNSVPEGLCPGERFRRNRSYFIAKHGVDPATYLPVG